jgi:hypothetical protein
LNAALKALALAALAVAGCASDDTSKEYQPGANDASVRPDSGVFADQGFPCQLSIDISSDSPSAPGGIIYAPAQLTATAQGTSSLSRATWSVTFPDHTTIAPKVVDPSSGRTVTVEANQLGSYTFYVSFEGSGCTGTATVDVHGHHSIAANYRLRVSPPESARVPLQDIFVTVYGNENQSLPITLGKGTPIIGTLNGPSGPIAGEVRLVADNGPDAVALTDASGSFALGVSSEGRYTPLLIPRLATLAPRTLGRDTGAALGAADFTVGAGQPVTGTVLDAAGHPLTGAKVLLRSGILPSGLGVTATDGSFSLRAEPAGDYALLVGADGWPELLLPGLVVAGPLTLAVRHQLGRAAVSAKVVASDGKTPVGGARVSLRSPYLDGAATVNGSTAGVRGKVNQVVLSQPDGTLPPLALPPLPAGALYDLLIEPPAGITDGVTALRRPLAGDDSWTLALQPRMTISGLITDRQGQPVVSARVTGFQTAGLGAAPSTTSGTDGHYALAVDPGSPITLLVEPPDATPLASVSIKLPAGTSRADALLPAGLRLSGTVNAPTTGTLPSALVEALCGSCGSDQPLASTVTRPDGSFDLYLPDPGVKALDGGVH